MALAKDLAGLAAITMGSAIFGIAIAHAPDLAFASSVASGPQVSQSRDVAPFERIRLEGAFTTTIVAGAKTRVVVRGDSTRVGDVTTEVRDGTLIVGTRRGHVDMGHMDLEIAVPRLRELENDGAGGSTVSGLAGDIAITNSGAGAIHASGRATHETVSLEGVGEIDTTGIDARDVTATDDGVGAVYVRGSGTLSLQVNGVGEIRYAGKPAHVDRQVDGIGSISPM